MQKITHFAGIKQPEISLAKGVKRSENESAYSGLKPEAYVICEICGHICF